MKCPKCGADVAENAKFCTSCGVNLQESLEEQAKMEVPNEVKITAENEVNEAEKSDENVPTEEQEIKPPENSEIEAKEEAKEEVKEEIKEEPKEEPKFTKKTSEDKKEKKKKHTGLKVFFILILIIILLIAGCYGLYKLEVLPESLSSIFEKVESIFEKEEKDEDNEDEEKEESDKKSSKKSENTVSNEVKEEKNKKEITKVDEDEELVYDTINKTIAGNTYKVPVINIDSIYIEGCNKEIKGYVESELKLYEKATKLPDDAITTCDYYWAQNDNILSVVFFIGKDDFDEYHVYNVDVYTGDIIVNSEILEAAKIEESSLAEKGSDAVKDFYENYAFDLSTEIDKTSTEYTTAYKSTIGKGNFDRYMKMFLNKNGELCVVARISIPGQYESEDVLLNVENKKRNSKQLIEGTKFPIKKLKLDDEESEQEDDSKVEEKTKEKVEEKEPVEDKKTEKAENKINANIVT